jgi:glycerol uptake facilitator-like aquaporin
MNDRPLNGWHWPEWSSELAWTAFLMFAVVSTWYWLDAFGGVWASFGVRVPILAAVAGAAVIAVAYSPPGRRSGAHLNPAVTFGLWLQDTVSGSDLAGYVVAQTVGGTAGIALGRIWGEAVARFPVQWAAIAPSSALPGVATAGIEAAATAVQLLIVYFMLRSRRTAPWAAVAAGVLLAVAIQTLAKVSGAGFNPVRGLAPDLLRWSFPDAWIYVVGPVLGAAAAGGLGLLGRRPMTGKLHHDPLMPCRMRCTLPHRTPPSDTTPRRTLRISRQIGTS